MSPEQCRAARAWLCWSQKDLANVTKVPFSAIRRFETSNIEPSPLYREILKRTFETIGIRFISDGSKPVGITYTDPKLTAAWLDSAGASLLDKVKIIKMQLEDGRRSERQTSRDRHDT